LAPVTVLHVEDHFWTRETVTTLLAAWPDVRQVGAVETGAEGIDACRTLRPDVLLLDLRLPDCDGFDVAEEVLGWSRPPRILLLSARADEAALFRVMRLPRAGMLWKGGSLATTLRQAIDQARRGRVYHAPEVVAAWQRLRRRGDAFFKLLSDRELELLPLLGRGANDREVAAGVGRSAATVHSQRQSIMGKLGLGDRAALMRWAAQNGFVDLAPPPGEWSG